jgi:carbon-monoxide dehydrogenase large subunit
MEHAVYDPDSGQLVTASLMDYPVPRADEVPAIAFETSTTSVASTIRSV